MRNRCVCAIVPVAWWQKITVHLRSWLVGFLCLVVSIYGKLLKFHRNLFPSFCVCVSQFGFSLVFNCISPSPLLLFVFFIHVFLSFRILSDLNVCVISLNVCKNYIWYANLCQKYAQNVKVFRPLFSLRILLHLLHWLTWIALVTFVFYLGKQ